MNTQDGAGLWGYHDNTKSLFSETSRYQKKKKIVAKIFLIFKYML